MQIDPVTLKVFGDHCQAAAESMAFTLFRTAHSTFVKETEDFTTGLATTLGHTFASPKDLGATWFVGLDYGNVVRAIGDYKPGDIGVTNDPYSGYVCTHSPDLHLWKPVFHEGEIVCFVVCHIHNTDIGGAVPASLSRSLTEIHQEGVRLPPCKLYESGVLNETLLNGMLINVRMPEQNWGDLKAQIASLETGERKIHEIIGKFGVEVFKAGVEELMALSERHARAIIRNVPNGKYFFCDYIDEDSDRGLPCRIAVTLDVNDDSLVVDFTGSDPQLQSALNVPTGGNEHHVLPIVGVNYVLYTLDPTLMLNSGVNRAIRCVLPEGTIVNPQFPAAVGMRSLVVNRMMGAVIGAFTQALPDLLPAGSQNGCAIMNVRTWDSRSGKLIMGAIDPITGGAGGSALGDGNDGSGADTAFLKNTPVEINESEFPIRVIEYSLETDSGGAGKYRGGLGTVLKFQVFSPETIVTARNKDRWHFSPFGMLGGNPGNNSRLTKNPDSDNPVELGNTDVVGLDPEDVLMVTAAGGGGWGDPFDRDPHLVLQDLRRKKISGRVASDIYGVAIVDGAIEPDATQQLRSARPTRRNDAKHYNYCRGRTAHEAVWTQERYADLTRILVGVPVKWRFFVKHKMFELVRVATAQDKSIDIAAAFEVLAQRYSELRPRNG